MRRRLFIDNFAPNTTRESLEAFFQVIGKVESVTLPTISLSDILSHAFVVMSNQRDAAKAIRALNNTDWNGYRLTVTHASLPDQSLAGGFARLERKTIR